MLAGLLAVAGVGAGFVHAQEPRARRAAPVTSSDDLPADRAAEPHEDESSVRRRGPIELREEWLLAQGRLNLAATSPDIVPSGRTQARLDLDWGNDFAFNQERVGETPTDRRYLVDGEHRTVSLTVRRGIGRRSEVGLRVPFRWRGPGILDGIIDWFHGVTRGLGIPDGGRASFLTNRFRVEGRDPAGRVLRGEAGSGLGNIELEARRLITESQDPRGWKTTAVGRIGLPTGGGVFDPSGAELGLQLVTARSVTSTLHVYGGLGGTFFTKREAEGVHYEAWRVHAFLASEWRFASAWSLIVQADGASRLVSNLAHYPGFQSYVRMGAQVDVAHSWTIEGGFTENLVSQDATTDFGVFVGVKRSF